MEKVINIKKKIFHLTLGIFLGLFILNLAFSREAFAQERIPLVVSPARQELVVNTGERHKLTVKFINESQIPLTGSLRTVDFIVTNENGTPTLLDDPEKNLANQFSAASWVNLPYEQATIAANDILQVNFSIDIPQDARPGGRYVAIYFETTGLLNDNSQSDQLSATSTRIVSLLSVRINGPITESAFISDLSIPKFLQFGKIPVEFSIFNKGDYHITPRGQVVLSNWFGKEIEKIILEPKNVFPDAKRDYNFKLGQTYMFGRYKVEILASYGESGKVVESSSYVWVFPITLILIIILSMIIMIMTVAYLNKRLTQKQKDLERKLEMEISELERLKAKFKDKLPK